MKTFFYITLFLGSLTISNAQFDPAAKQKLDKLSAKFKSYKSFKATFLYELDGPDDFDEKYNGTISVRQNQFHIKTDNGVEIICDGKNSCNYNAEDEEVTLYEYDPEDGETITPTSVVNMYKTGYKYRMLTAETVMGSSCDVVELIPEDTDQGVFKIKLYIKKSNGILKRWRIYEKTGNKYTVTIKTFSPNVALSSNEFVCSPSSFPSGAEFNDLR